MQSASSLTSAAQNGSADVEDGRQTAEHRRLKAQLHQQLVANMNLAAMNNVNQDTLRSEVRRVLEELCNRSNHLLNRPVRERLVTEVMDETFGLGPLEPLMADPTVTDILINGHQTVYVERGGRLERAPITFTDEKHLLFDRFYKSFLDALPVTE